MRDFLAQPRVAVGSWRAWLLILVLVWLSQNGWLTPIMRMQPDIFSLDFWLFLLLGQIADIVVHESGHALAARLLGCRVRAISVGPLVIWRDSTGRRYYRFQWSGTSQVGGYTAPVPNSERMLRLRMVGVIFAGPLASFLAGMGLILAFILFAGTDWEPYVKGLGFVPIMMMVSSLANLVPAGHCDGTMLLNLILWNQEGDDILSSLRQARYSIEADEAHERGDLDRTVELRRIALTREIEISHREPHRVAELYLRLGRAEREALAWRDAETSLRKGLASLERCKPARTAHEIWAWGELHRIYAQHHRVADAESVRASVEAVLEQWNRETESPEEFGTIAANLAVVHLSGGRAETASDELDLAATTVAGDRRYRVLEGTLNGLRAACEFRLGHVPAAMEAAGQAEAKLRRAVESDNFRIAAAAALGELGEVFWLAGRLAPAAALLQKSVALLEDQGAPMRAAPLRLKLASVLLRQHLLADAEGALPAPDHLSRRHQRYLPFARAEIHLCKGRAKDAIVEAQEALRLAREDPQNPKTEIATAQALLAEALFRADRIEDAEAQAREAQQVLTEAQHPGAARPLLTLAFIAWLRYEDSARALLDEAIRVTRTAPLLDPSFKAWFFEDAARDLDRAGRSTETTEVRRLAAAQWRSLGLEEGAEEALAMRTDQSGSC